jgi:hypothetical protein
MPDIAWVCLSDLHFGAENSLLSLVKDDASVNADDPSPVLEALIECLRVVIGINGDSPLPTLILNGDILELALAEDNVAAMVFDRFIDLAFDPVHPLFDSTILFLPGNHDHHIWETAREHMYAEYVAHTPPGSELAAPYHATRMFVERSPHSLEAELLNALVRRRRGPRLHVRVVYPNLGLEGQNSDRQVLLHHGHFTESIYRLVTYAKSTLFPRQRLGDEVWDWESDNFAWIDFFWSTLGRSGTAGRDVGLIYDMLQDESAIRRLVGELGDFAGNHAYPPIRPVARMLGRHLAGGLVDLVKGRERQHPNVTLTDDGCRGLKEYLRGPVALQFHREQDRKPTEGLSFVFGHTHKPFESILPLPEFPAPLSLYNNGGWVVDTPTTAETQGASVILIDSDCNVASLRMYNQADSADSYRVRLASEPSPAPNGFLDQLESELDFERAPWIDFSKIAAVEVARRHRLLPQIIQRGLAYTD